MSSVGYARVSTLEQSMNLQMDALQRAGCINIFQDQESGTKDDRPGLSAALHALKPGDTLVVWRLDRLGRSVPHLISLISDLRSREIDFRSLTESIDSSTPGGRLVFTLFAALAAFEVDIIRSRTRAGLEAARARGRIGGRPTKLSECKLDAALSLLNHQNLPASKVCEMLNVGRSTLYRAIRERKMGGEDAK